MKILSTIIVICLLAASAPVCRAQEMPQAQARTDSTATGMPAGRTAGTDSIMRLPSPADTLRAMSSSTAKPAPRRWDRPRIIIVGCAALLLVVTGIVAIKASYWPGGK